MKRTNATLAVLVTVIAGLTTLASADAGAVPARASSATRVSVRHTGKGNILVSSAGRTVYEFTRDATRQDSCMKVRECTGTWPPLLSSGRPLAGSGASSSLLSTISLPGGRKQVTYAGHALYLYSGDSGPGQTAYIGEREFGGLWYGINAAGHAVK